MHSRPSTHAVLRHAALALALLASACSSVDKPVAPVSVAEPDPVVRERIRAYENGTTRQLLGILRMQRADGQAFYLIDAPCCDQVNPLYDADGRRICAPTGGFAGSGDGKCPGWVRGLKLSLPPHLKASGKPPALQQGY